MRNNGLLHSSIPLSTVKFPKARENGTIYCDVGTADFPEEACAKGFPGLPRMRYGFRAMGPSAIWGKGGGAGPFKEKKTK